jgi:hypothetical protein
MTLDRSLLGIGVGHLLASVLFFAACRHSARASRAEVRSGLDGRPAMRRLLRQSRAPFAAAIGKLAFGPLLRLVIGLTSGAAALGLFEALTRPHVSLGVLLGSTVGPLFPEFAAQSATLRRGEPAELDRRVHRGLLALGLFVWGAATLACAPALAWTGHRALVPALAVLSLAYLTNMLATPSYYRSLAVGPSWAAPASVLIQGGIAIAGAAVLSKGGAGPLVLDLAFSTSVAGAFLGLAVYGLGPLGRALAAGTRAGLPAGVVLLAVAVHQALSSSVTVLIADAAAGTVLLGAAAWWRGPLGPSERAGLVGALLERVRARRVAV